ncbi:Fur-regulated basic protein FbpA [Bacillus sp. 03113]|uniref:Fur-regulated basic protein FbpA n=1 Tax=Bacillus sp. 03113 TaxID=2578211 RepID=UPI00215C9750|nr:Fur-regulated basic protein FbpA [Bacillus sp. 03113]
MYFFKNDKNKEDIINELLNLGIYKKGNYHLFELSVDELLQEYEQQLKNNEHYE